MEARDVKRLFAGQVSPVILDGGMGTQLASAGWRPPLLPEEMVLEDPEAVKTFCRAVQEAAPVDSFVTPEPWDMPGYDCPVIMAAGAFIQGSSIELSADAPMREPYIVYFQGGLTHYHGKLGLLLSVQRLVDSGFLTIG